jgi:imidazole glycerol-phosphate synthase subunit HisH
MLVIVDYGMGNIRSVEKAFCRIGVEVKVSSEIEEITRASKLILPGVGNFEEGMKNLNEKNLIEPIKNVVNENQIPLLGICLGMQLLTNRSEEGDAEGLSIIDVNTVSFRSDTNSKVPHMGWNGIHFEKNDPLFNNLTEDDEFYFAHSYHIDINSHEKYILASTRYDYNFPTIIKKGKVFGVQFHPEKSHDSGLQLLKNFIDNSNV